MKVVVFSGGSGSTQLLKGLSKFFSLEDISVIINAYDNGLSTGVCRKVLDGRMLGPSDLRKVQLLQASIYGTCDPKLLEYLNTRKYAQDSKEMYVLMRDDLIKIYNNDDDCDKFTRECYDLIVDSINAFFEIPAAKNVQYNDFSYSNIIYTGCASMHGCSLKASGLEIAEKILNIPQSAVQLISDESLFLQAVTESGRIILDEGEIVDWNNKNDKIVKIQLVNSSGELVVPSILSDAQHLINEADLIIFSSGTQWSSLIPSYVHENFYELIQKSRAKKYLVSNLTQDKDMKGVTSGQLIDILKNFLPMENITTVYSVDAVAEMSIENDSTSYEKILLQSVPDVPLDSKQTHVHNSFQLSSSILGHFTKDMLDVDFFVFDFDDTLVARKSIGKSNVNVSLENLRLFFNDNKMSVITGNSKKWIEEKLKWYLNFYPGTKINNYFFCDGGNSVYTWDAPSESLKFLHYVETKWVMDNDDVQRIISTVILTAGIDLWKVENRNNCMISIKPIDNREKVAELLLSILSDRFDVNCNGKTTIDIVLKGYDKNCVREVYDKSKVSYFGDEVVKGNDSCLKDLSNFNCYQVNSITETNTYLKIIQACNKESVRI